MSDRMDELPAITPARDEMENYRRSARSEAPRQSNFNGLLVFVILLMAIVMGAGGYALWEVQKKLDEADLLLSKGQQNIQDLEARLAATGTDVSKTLQEMQVEIKDNFKQIDLLWGHAYRKNRPNIEKNTAAISAVQREIDSKLKPLSRSVNQVQAGFTTLKADVDATKASVQDDAEELTTQVSLLRGQVQDQTTIAEANRRNIAILTKQLGDVDEAIEVIDRYRQQINQRLVELQNRVQEQSVP